MFFLQGLYEGIINGSILALVAMGIALVWGVMNILSFSQGEFLMLGMFVSYYVNINCTQDYGQQEKWRPRLVDRLKSKDVP